MGGGRVGMSYEAMTQEKERLRVLVVEDDADDFFITRRLLSKTRSIECDLEWARTYEEGLDEANTGRYDVGIVDYRLGPRTGLDLLREVNESGNSTPMILLTGQGDLEVDLNALMAGAADYLVKGEIDEQLLERSIRYARGRKRAEERIHEQAALLDKARDAICAFDLDGKVQYWNRSAERLSGWSADEILGENAIDRLYIGEEDRIDEARETLYRDGEWTGELRQQTKAGEEVIVESRWTLVRDGGGGPKSVLMINTDITERKRLERQFLRSQRMESIGRLVGGIAHDLGNLLAPIVLGVKVLQNRFDDDRTQRTLGMIEKSAERGSEMVKQVLAFARGVDGERQPMRPEQVIAEVERITEETFPNNVDVVATVDDDLWGIVGDSTQLQQVLMNLCVNARDAMPEGGRLEIKAYNVELDEHAAQMNLEAAPGRFMCLCVEDTGTGIPPDELDKIFEPFFSTKPTGEGTGLGLSTVYSIVKSHDGFMDVSSTVDEGTTFYIYLPATDDAVAEEVEQREDAVELRDGRGELVLVVDDEEYVLETMYEALQDAGYRTMTARDGREALEIFRSQGDEIDAVVTDLMMPDIDGFELIRTLAEEKPGLPIIASSALSGDKPDRALQLGADSFLSKPYRPEELCRTIQELIESRETAA